MATFDIFFEIDLHFSGTFVGGRIVSQGSCETVRRGACPQFKKSREAILNYFEFVSAEARLTSPNMIFVEVHEKSLLFIDFLQGNH